MRLDMSSVQVTESVLDTESMTEGDALHALKLSCEARAIRAMRAHGLRRMPASEANKRLAAIRQDLEMIVTRYA